MFGVYYCPPGLSLESISYLNNSLLSIAAYRHSIVLCGDFNVPNIEWASVSQTLDTSPADHWCSTVLDNSLFQHADCPTRDNNILDLVLSSGDCVSSVNVFDNLPSTDHSAVKFHLSDSIPVQHSTQRFLYNYKKANFSTFREVLFHVPWSCVTDCNDIDYTWTLWKDLFFSTVEKCKPQIHWKRRKMKHWFNSITIAFIHTKRQFYLIKKRKPNSTIAATNYRKISNVVRCLTRCDTKEHTSRICHLNINIIIIIIILSTWLYNYYYYYYYY